MTINTNLTDLATTIAAALKASRVLLNNNATDLAALTTTEKGNLVGALNELKTAIDAASVINDAASNTTTSWSGSKVASEISSSIATAVSDLVNGAPLALDTLSELATALGDNDSDIAALVTGLDNRVRYDAAQTLDAGEKVQVNANTGSVSLVTFGATDTDYAAAFTTALTS